jgi:hypothetical protein
MKNGIIELFPIFISKYSQDILSHISLHRFFTSSLDRGPAMIADTQSAGIDKIIWSSIFVISLFVTNNLFSDS